MVTSPLALGIDLGSSGLRLALIGLDGCADHRPLVEEAGPYPRAFIEPDGWREGLITLTQRLPTELRERVKAIALDGTSGTLLLCRDDGSLAKGTLRQALAYHQCCADQASAAAALAGAGPAASASGSLARALTLLAKAAVSGETGPWRLRHQADWLMGWLLGDWRWGEEGNNIRLGWDLQQKDWRGRIAAQPWSDALPSIRPSGAVLGRIAAGAATALNLPDDCMIVAGSTDANAAVLAAQPGEHDGITVLGTTLVLKQWHDAPIEAPGVSCHRVADRWLVGGASNAGGGVLRRFFTDTQLRELSRQINPEHSSGLHLRPLPAPGERFPVDDPSIQPVLEPRPVSDALYLHGLLEGLARIEADGWQRLQDLGVRPVRRVISLGGGAMNPQWRRLRERRLGVPVLNRPGCTAALGMARLAASALARQP
jgi:sugar (pentulose or hexulose) kinase